MMSISYYDLRRDEVLWECLLRIPLSLLPGDISEWSAEKILRFFSPYTGNICTYGNIYVVYNIFDIKYLISQLYDLQSKIQEILSTQTLLSIRQIARLRSRIVHYNFKVNSLLILYPGIISESFLLVEDILKEILSKWIQLDKSFVSFVDINVPELTNAISQDQSILYNNVDNEMPTVHQQTIPSVSNVVPSNLNNSMIAHNNNGFPSFNMQSLPSQMSHNEIKFRNLESPLLQNFADKRVYTGRTFRDIFDFLVKLVHLKRQMKIWNLLDRHAFQVISQFTADKLLECVELALLRNKSIDQFHMEILNFFCPINIQQQLSTRLMHRGQGVNENISDFVRDIKLYYEVFRIEISEVQFVTDIVTRFNIQSRISLPLSTPPTTFYELDMIINKVKAVQLNDHLTATPELNLFNVDNLLDLPCENSPSIGLSGISERNSNSNSPRNSATNISQHQGFQHASARSRHIPFQTSPNTSVNRQNNYTRPNLCFRCNSPGHLVRYCPFPSQRSMPSYHFRRS